MRDQTHLIAQQNNNNKKVSGTFAHPALRQAIAMNAAPSHGAQVLNPRLRRRTFAGCASLARPYSAFKNGIAHGFLRWNSTRKSFLLRRPILAKRTLRRLLQEYPSSPRLIHPLKPENSKSFLFQAAPKWGMPRRNILNRTLKAEGGRKLEEGTAQNRDQTTQRQADVAPHALRLKTNNRQRMPPPSGNEGKTRLM